MPLPPLAILGMHRSGTSLAASLLQSAGLDVGSRLMPASGSNPRGHFEDLDFVEFQRSALERLGAHPEGWVTSVLPEVPESLVERARALVDGKALRGHTWGWKDPRTVPLLPLWRLAVPDLRFAIVYRAPWEVVESLFARGDEVFAEDPERAVAVWIHYGRLLLDLLRDMPERCVVANARVVADAPREWVAAVAARGLPLADPDPSRSDERLWHRDDARSRSDLLFEHYPEVVEVFTALEQASFRPEGAASGEAWTSTARAGDRRREAMRGWQATVALRRARTESSAAGPPVPPPEAGWCACCRSETTFVETGTWLRDQYRCAACDSIPRFRAINTVLDRQFPGWERARIHEFAPVHDFVRRHCADYSATDPFEGLAPGASRDAVRSARLSHLPFADATFDLFITQDVLEHVFDPAAALREIHRVLKPGGAHVFTTPKHRGLPASRQRARLDDGAVVHLLEPQYHGDPLSETRELVTWDYGDDFECLYWTWTAVAAINYIMRDRKLGLDGEFLDVFLARKPVALSENKETKVI